MRTNPILNTDSYKTSHYLQYPPGTKRVTSYIEARGSKFPWIDRTVFFGIRAFVEEYLRNPFTETDIMEAWAICSRHGVPFNFNGWVKMRAKHGGYFPVEVLTRQEGELIKLSTPLVVVENTDEEFPWITSYLETAILRAIWYPTTVATISNNIYQDLLIAADITGTDRDWVKFKLHDFGARGASSNESAMLGGMAHLINFAGTDTIQSLVGCMRYYHMDSSFPGFSIPAAEHSTITAWGDDKEVDAYRNMLKMFARPDSIVAVVSDSYDIWNAVDNLWGGSLRKEVEDSGATVVVRPDSGDPVETPVMVIDHLMEKFGYTTNTKGFKVLPDCIRVIQGDGVDQSSIRQILSKMISKGFAVDNIAFGMGGALLQKLDRDTFKFAMKASAIQDENGWRGIYKKPSGDASKASKPGRFVELPLKSIYRKGERDSTPIISERETFDSVRENMIRSL